MAAQQQQQAKGECGDAERRKVAAPAADVTMDLDILNCRICFLPLRPPIFQVRSLLVNLRR